MPATKTYTVTSATGSVLAKGLDKKAAPVIVEELTDAVTLKGQLGLWAVDGVSRAMRGRR